MTTIESALHSPQPAAILDGVRLSMEVATNPMFLVAVQAGPVLRFAGLNRAHEDATGIAGAIIAGKTPQEALPPRLAETVLANYMRCLETGERYTYEECLELPTGRRWWQTTLTPVRSGETVIALLGSAFDITGLKAEIARLRFAVETHPDALNREAGGEGAAEAARGPLAAIIGLVRSLDGHSPCAQTQTALDLIALTAVHAIAAIDRLSAEVRSRRRAIGHKEVDFGHLCRDFAALADPSGAIAIRHPDLRILCSEDALQIVLHAAIDEVARYAGSRIAITVQPDPMRADGIEIAIAFDGLAGTRVDERMLGALAALYGFRLACSAEGPICRIVLGLGGRILDAPDTATVGEVGHGAAAPAIGGGVEPLRIAPWRRPRRSRAGV